MPVNPLLWAAFSPICLSHKELRQACVSVSATYFITVLKEKPWVSLLIGSLQPAIDETLAMQTSPKSLAESNKSRELKETWVSNYQTGISEKNLNVL